MKVLWVYVQLIRERGGAFVTPATEQKDCNPPPPYKWIIKVVFQTHSHEYSLSL